MVKHEKGRSLAARLAQPQSSQVEPVSVHWSQERKAQPLAQAAPVYMHSIVALHEETSKERHALQEQCLVEQRWAPESAGPRAANEAQQSVQVRVQPVLISTRVASVITDVTS